MKKIRKTLLKSIMSFVLTIAMVLGTVPVDGLVLPAYAAAEETKTFTISHAVGDPNNDYCGTITYDGYDFLIPDANIMQNQRYDDRITMRSKMYNSGNEGTVKLYPRISGKVKSLTFSSARVSVNSDVVGTEHYVKIGKGDIWTNSYTEDISSATTLTFNFTNDDGLQLANENEYLEIKMRNSEPTRNASFLISGTITITYEPTASTLTHTHNFSYNATGNTLTATCAHDDGKECDLASYGYKISTSLIAPTNLIYTDGWSYPASMSGFENFKSETNATISSITYKNTDTGEDLGTTAPNSTGTYTASVTINVGGTDYTLTTSYCVTDYHFVYNNYPQFTITTDKSGNYAGNGQTVTITFTPKFGETLTGLTVTGSTTNYSLSSGITDNNDNTYTFTMPGEDVNIGATFSISENDFAQTGENEYTIKTNNGWNWFCFAVNFGLVPDGFSGKTVKLATDVESSEMAGMSAHPFKGTFDGQNHTLTFNHEASEDLSAPFHYINGATISNLHVEGTITGGTYESLGGLVGRAEGNITIENCHVSTQISTTVNGSALHGGVIARWNGTNATCTVTGCVYDGLIYNPDEAGVTRSCSGFIGWDYGNNGTITFTDCLSAPAAYGTGKYALGDNCFTFVYPNSEPTLTYNMTNCYYTSILGNRQGRPAATATTAPANLGAATTDHGMVKGYENGFLYAGNYYTPKYGDVVVEYIFTDYGEHADVTINGEGNNLVGVNITEEVGNIKSVTYNRTFSSGKTATVILPFSYICNGNEGGKFYSFAGFNGTTPIMEDGNQVTSLTANTPYLFKPEGTTMTFPNIASMTGGSVTLKTTAKYHTAVYGDWTLYGTYASKTWTGNEVDYSKTYFLDKGILANISPTITVKPTDGYFITSDSYHTHRFTYSATGATITATCSAADCTLTDKKATLTIVAPTLTTYGGTGDAEASITGDTTVLGTPVITYRKGEVTLDNAPTDAGTYTASITLGTGDNMATASVTYEIAKDENPVVISPDAVSLRCNDQVDLSVLVKEAKGDVTYTITTALTGCSVNTNGVFTAGTTAGTCVVSVTAAGNDNYKEKTVTITVTVSAKVGAVVSIGGASTITKSYGDAAFQLTASADENNGAWTWTSSDANVATVAADTATATVTILKASTTPVTITARYESATAAGSASIELTVNPKSVTITGLTVSDKEYDGTTTATVNGTAVIDGKVGNDDVIVSSGTATFADENVGTGKTVTFSGWSLTGTAKDNYTLAAQPASVTADIDKAANPVQVAGTASVLKGGNTVDLSLNVKNAQGTVNYSITSALEGCTVSENTGVFTSGNATGDCTVTVTISGNENYNETTAAITVAVTDKQVQTISFETDTQTKTYGDEDFTVAAMRSVGDSAISYAVTEGTDVATVDNTGKVHILKAGTAIIKATAAETNTYAVATAQYTLTVNPKSVTIPAAVTGLKWTGAEQTGVSDGADYSVTDGKATDVGIYTATAALKDKANTKWSNGSTDDQSISWSIAKADGPAAPTGLIVTAPTTDGGSDGKISGVNSTMEYSDNSGFTSKTDCAGTEITGLSAGTYYVRVKETETHEAGDYATVKVPAYVAPTYEVTYKVVGGTWSDDSTTNKTETVQSGSKPASVPTGMKAGLGYMGGAWDKDPAEVTITGATTFTYTFTAKQAAIVKKAPTAKTLTYTGSAQELVTAGEATGGTMYYAATTENTAPADNLYTTSIPTATNAGTYYVWYKVVGNENYTDYNADTPIEVVIAKSDNIPKNLPDKMSVSQSVDKIEQGILDAFVGWKWAEGEIGKEIPEGGSVSANAIYGGSDKDNYNITEATVEVSRANHDHTGGKATCHEQAVCEICGQPYGGLDATNHSGETEIRDSKDVSCTEDGYTGDTYCLGCDTMIQKGTLIPAEGHVPAEAVKENEVTATCTTAGSYEEVVKCSVCGEEISRKTVTVPATGHDWDDWKVVKPATETEEGVEERVCKNDSSHKETRSIAKLEPKPATDNKDNPSAGNDTTTESPKPTEAPAAKGVTLEDAGTKAVYIVTSATGEEPAVEYKASESITDKKEIIPDSVTINGVTYKITKIADNAFAKNKKIEKVVLNSNIKSIGSGAFSGCTKLKSVTIGSKVTEIGNNAFANCPALTKVTIPVNVTKIGKNAFKGDKKLKTITIKTTKLTSKNVSNNAFKGVGNKVTIKVPKKMKKTYTKLFRKKGLSKKVKIK